MDKQVDLFDQAVEQKFKNGEYSTALADNWESLWGLNSRNDHSAQVTKAATILLTDTVCSDVYASEGIGSMIIKKLPEQMVMTGYRVVGDNDGKMHKELKRLNNAEHMKLALYWQRTYGGAVTVIGAADGKKLDKPLRNNVKRIDWLRTVSRTRIITHYEDIVKEPKSADFGEPEFFYINFGYDQNYVKVHRSRCLVYKGLPMPDDPHFGYSNYSRRYWGMSALQPVYDALRNLGGSFQGITHLLQELVIGKYAIKDLGNMLASGEYSLIMKRINVIHESKSNINAVLMDAEGEDYTRESLNVSGVDKVVEQLMIILSAVSGYPVTVLFGRSPDGMNATGESDLENYDAMVESHQETILEQPQQKLVKIINSYLKVPGIDADPVVEFNPIRKPSAKEVTEIRKTTAETDKMYWDMGVLSAEQIQEMRFVGGYDYSRMDIDNLKNGTDMDADEPDTDTDIDVEE